MTTETGHILTDPGIHDCRKKRTW